MTSSRPAITDEAPVRVAAEVGVILFAHGARDARWAEPFVRVAEKVRAAGPALAVELAFLEFMTPDLATAAARLARVGVTRIRVVPLFLGRGGHVREDLPRLVESIAATLPGIPVDLALAAGDDEGVIEALARFCLSEASAS